MDAPGVTDAFRKQAGWCESLGSPFTAHLLRLLLDDIGRGGAAAELVGDWPGDPVADALPLRLAAGLHALVLRGAAPDLASCYPPTRNPAALPKILAETLAGHAAALRRFIASPPQTNEVSRSGVLLGGFLRIAAETGLALRIFEIGASAGLNLVWDRYRYQLGDAIWGDPDSKVTLTPEWSGGQPPVDAPLAVAERAACDVAPIDLGDGEQRLRLRAYIWADQHERLARLDAAIGVARACGHAVDRADADEWLDARLAPAPGRATVLYHSIMWQYMPAPTQARIRARLDAAGSQATAASPLAWLRFEPTRPDARPELRLDLWPGPRDVRLAVAHPHGTSVQWVG